VVEIGTHMGGTFFVLCRCALPDATVIRIDLLGPQFSGGYSKLSSDCFREMPAKTQTFPCLRSDSHDEKSVE
jgi:hypothetical protein